MLQEHRSDLTERKLNVIQKRRKREHVHQADASPKIRKALMAQSRASLANQPLPVLKNGEGELKVCAVMEGVGRYKRTTEARHLPRPATRRVSGGDGSASFLARLLQLHPKTEPPPPAPARAPNSPTAPSHVADLGPPVRDSEAAPRVRSPPPMTSPAPVPTRGCRVGRVGDMRARGGGGGPPIRKAFSG